MAAREQGRGGRQLAKTGRGGQSSLSNTDSLRLRAAWLYYNRGLTQADIAERLGISRSTVIRMLEEAQRRAEVQIWINPTPGDCTEMALKLEERLGLHSAIIVPGEGDPEETANGVGAALGRLLTDLIVDDMTVGVGWGRTLSASLRTYRPQRRDGVRIVSLLGGAMQVSRENPAEYSWRMASHIGADCLLFLAPLIVDSADTKRRLIEDCGLWKLVDTAGALDVAVVSCGDIGRESSSLSRAFLSDADHAALVAAGAVCDAMCHFLDAEGRTVDHPIHERVMSVELDSVAKAKRVVLASGGRTRATAIRATIRRIGCHTLVTDEAAARALLELA